MIVSESFDDRPEVGSSRKSTDGSLISSSAILSLFLWPPLRILLNGSPTLKSFLSSKPRFSSVSSTIEVISSEDLLLKHWQEAK